MGVYGRMNYVSLPTCLSEGFLAGLYSNRYAYLHSLTRVSNIWDIHVEARSIIKAAQNVKEMSRKLYNKNLLSAQSQP